MADRTGYYMRTNEFTYNSMGEMESEENFSRSALQSQVLALYAVQIPSVDNKSNDEIKKFLTDYGPVIGQITGTVIKYALL